MAMFFKDKRQTNESRDAQTSPKFARSESKKSINNSMHHEFKREETGQQLTFGKKQEIQARQELLSQIDNLVQQAESKTQSQANLDISFADNPSSVISSARVSKFNTKAPSK